ncbi:MAG: hypothetical protein HY747_08755, partial [Elusimicrobia bacterium]|nr:hypothetical protein [Elusimicrobiota bacterium]
MAVTFRQPLIIAPKQNKVKGGRCESLGSAVEILVGRAFWYAKNMNIDQEIQKVTSIIIERYQPQSVMLFGSAAWADKTKAQDIDLC